MKRIIPVVLIMCLCIALVGCGSSPEDNQAATTTPSAQSNTDKGKDQPSSSQSGTAVSDKEAVPLLEDFPKEVPIVEGVVWGCKKLDIKDLKTGEPTGQHLFRVNIDTTMADVSEVREFYKSKFTSVTREGYVDKESSSPMAEIQGYIGDWNLNVIAAHYNKKGPVEATIMVRHKDTMNK